MFSSNALFVLSNFMFVQVLFTFLCYLQFRYIYLFYFSNTISPTLSFFLFPPRISWKENGLTAFILISVLCIRMYSSLTQYSQSTDSQEQLLEDHLESRKPYISGQVYSMNDRVNNITGIFFSNSKTEKWFSKPSEG